MPCVPVATVVVVGVDVGEPVVALGDDAACEGADSVPDSDALEVDTDPAPLDDETVGVGDCAFVPEPSAR
jgi:hypothetical protein